jgi:biotin carboxylase
MLGEQVVGVVAKHLGPHPHFVETGHDYPAPRPGAELTELGAVATAALRALGLGWGPAHVELRYTAAGPAVIEVNPRLAGGMIPRLLQEATGIDLIRHVVENAVGRASVPEPPRPLPPRAASIRFLVAARSGRLLGFAGLEQARRRPHIVEVAATAEPGQEMTLRHSFADRVGYVIAVADHGRVAASAATRAARSIAIRIGDE